MNAVSVPLIQNISQPRRDGELEASGEPACTISIPEALDSSVFTAGAVVALSSGGRGR